MNPFTHAYSFESPGFYKCNVVMCQKLLRSANQSLPHKHTLLTRSSFCCCSQNWGSTINIFSATWDALHYTGRSGRALLHHGIEDKTQFAVGMQC